MVWLFGQIWLWLVVAFALGALASWLVLRTAQRPKPEPQPEPEPDVRYEEPSAAEQTQFIPAAAISPAPSGTRTSTTTTDPSPPATAKGTCRCRPSAGRRPKTGPPRKNPPGPSPKRSPRSGRTSLGAVADTHPGKFGYAL